MYLGRLLQGSTWYKYSAKLTPPGSGCPLPLGSPPGDASGARPSCPPPQSCWRAISEELLVISRPGWDSRRRTSTLVCTWSASSASCSVVPWLPCPRLPLAPPRSAIAMWPNRWWRYHLRGGMLQVTECISLCCTVSLVAFLSHV